MWMYLFLMLATYSANQGSAVRLTIPNEPTVNSVEVVWETKKVPAFLQGDAWITILGVDLDAKPGDHKADILLTMSDLNATICETDMSAESGAESGDSGYMGEVTVLEIATDLARRKAFVAK